MHADETVGVALSLLQDSCSDFKREIPEGIKKAIQLLESYCFNGVVIPSEGPTQRWIEELTPRDRRFSFSSEKKKHTKGKKRISFKAVGHAIAALNMWVSSTKKSNRLVATAGSDWTFDVCLLTTERPLSCVSRQVMCGTYGVLINKLQVDIDVLLSAVSAIEDTYHKDNPYHDATHAADVLSTFCTLVERVVLHNWLSEVQFFAALMACVVHDMDHPGLNNSFQVRVGDEKAVRYNDQSVLEMHSVTLALDMLLSPPYNEIFSKWSKESVSEFRATLIDLVLATDMARHFDLLSQFRNCVAKDEIKPILLTQMLLKCADISNEAKPVEIAKKWGDRVVREFFAQGDKEREMGLTVSPLMDRTKNSMEDIQVSFIDFVLHPLFLEMEKWNSFFSVPLQYLKECREYWCEVKEGEKSPKKKRRKS